jgi:hypothetical protein
MTVLPIPLAGRPATTLCAAAQPFHDNIEQTAPWHERQLDATAAVIAAALKAKWPCPH